MNKRVAKLIIITIFASGCASSFKTKSPDNNLHTYTSSYNNANFNSFLLKDEDKVALWLGEKLNNKYLVEPINILILDSISKSDTESINSIEGELSRAGFTKNSGHSSGYLAVINNTRINQIPKEYRIAYSDDKSWRTNNHGRIFGPYKTKKNQRIYIGQFSRESFQLFASVHHKYVSFNIARDTLINNANKNTRLKYVTDLNANNILHSDLFTSADHDGVIKILSLQTDQ